MSSLTRLQAEGELLGAELRMEWRMDEEIDALSLCRYIMNNKLMSFEQQVQARVFQIRLIVCTLHMHEIIKLELTAALQPKTEWVKSLIIENEFKKEIKTRSTLHKS